MAASLAFSMPPLRYNFSVTLVNGITIYAELLVCRSAIHLKAYAFQGIFYLQTHSCFFLRYGMGSSLINRFSSGTLNGVLLMYGVYEPNHEAGSHSLMKMSPQ